MRVVLILVSSPHLDFSRKMDVQECGRVMPFLRSCRKETTSPISGELTGSVPEWLQGTLIRIGSGLLDIGPDHYAHIFDGLALMHKFTIQNGQVTYQNRFLRSDTYKKNIEANRIIVSEFATRALSPDPCKTIFQRFSNYFKLDDFSDNDLVNIVKYTDEFYACSETNQIWKIDPDTLESQVKVDLRKVVPILGGTAHPHEDRDGTVYNVGNLLSSKGGYTIIKFPPKVDGQRSVFDKGHVIANIPASRKFAPGYFHSFGMSENYFAFIEQPLVLSIPRIIVHKLVCSTIADCLQWRPEYKTRFHIIRRKDGALLQTKYISDAFMLFHHINTYEEDGHLVMDICCYENGDVVKGMYVKALQEYVRDPNKIPTEFKAQAKRYVLPLKINEEQKTNLIQLMGTTAQAALQNDGSIKCEPEILSEKEWPIELPRINYEKYNGRKYKYFYAVAKTLVLDQVVKVDVENKITLYWEEKGSVPSEPVFVANPNSVEGDEDDGIVIFTILFEDDDCKVALVFVDPKTMKEFGRTVFKSESVVPGDFHGIFIPKSS